MNIDQALRNLELRDHKKACSHDNVSEFESRFGHPYLDSDPRWCPGGKPVSVNLWAGVQVLQEEKSAVAKRDGIKTGYSYDPDALRYQVAAIALAVLSDTDA